MKKVIVTGGAGYVGSHFCKALSQAGIEPFVIDNLSTGYRSFVKWGPLYECDLRDQNQLSSIMNRIKPCAVAHFAASSLVGDSARHPDQYFQNNINSCSNLLLAMNQAKVRKLIFSSSCAVYGAPQTSPLDESLRLEPINNYGYTKKVCEEMIERVAKTYQMKSITFRYFNACGADQDGEVGESHTPETHLIPLALQAASKTSGATLKIFGTSYATPDGTAVRDYVHVSDLAKAHLLGLEKLSDANFNFRPYNLGIGKGYSVREVIAQAEKVTEAKIRFEVAPPRDGDPAILIADPERAKNELNWHPTYEKLDSIISTAWHWYNHPKLS